MFMVSLFIFTINKQTFQNILFIKRQTTLIILFYIYIYNKYFFRIFFVKFSFLEFENYFRNIFKIFKKTNKLKKPLSLISPPSL